MTPQVSNLTGILPPNGSLPAAVSMSLEHRLPHLQRWWRQVLSFWNAMAQADSRSIINIVLHDAIAIAQNGCSYGRAALSLQMLC